LKQLLTIKTRRTPAKLSNIFNLIILQCLFVCMIKFYVGAILKYLTSGWFWISAIAMSTGFFVWLNIDQAGPTQAPSMAPKADFTPLTSPHAKDISSAGTGAKHVVPGVRISAEMLAAFNSAQSYRAFIYSAIKHPEQGGYAYALHVLTECGRVEQWENEMKLSALQHHALDVLRSRCNMTAAEREDFLREINADKQMNAERDPLLQTMGNRLPGASDQAERARLSQQLLEWADPLSVGVVQSREQYTDRNGETRERVFLNGQWYEEPAMEQMNLGWQLANCALGQACGADATSTLELCITRGWCASSVQEAILQGSSDPVEQKKVEEIKTQIVNAIQTQNLRAFISPKGNSPLLQ